MKKILLLWLACAGLARAQALPTSGLEGGDALGPSVKATDRVDRTHARLGETIVLTIDVSYNRHTELDLPAAASLRFEPFEVRDAVETDLTPKADRKEARYTVRLAAYENGRQTIPSVGFSYIAADGSLQRTQSPPVTIDVERGAALAPHGKNVEIHDIKPMQAVATPWWMTVGLCVAAGLLVAMLGLGLTALIRSYRRSKLAPSTPDGVALAALDELASDKLPEKGRLQLHYDRLAAILRNYLAQRFALPVLEHTTGEVIAMLEQMGFPEALCRQLGPVLIEADLVKFARLAVAPQRAMAQLEVVRNIVESTRPVEQLEGPSAAEGISEGPPAKGSVVRRMSPPARVKEGASTR